MADHQTTKIDKSNHLLLDQTLLRLPYDLMRKNFRNAHFVVEHESKAITKLLKDTATGSLKGKHSSDDVLKNIDAMLAKAKGIKRKLQACSDEEARLYRQLGARIKHVGEVVSMETVDDVRYEQWSRTRLDRLIVDYMLRHGYNESACALADDRGIRDLVDIDTFIHMSRIQESLANRSVTEALAWCHENKKELRKIDSNFEFMLRFQQYIELVRSQTLPKVLEAITHARKYLIPFKETYPHEVNQAAGLLAYPPEQTSDSYSNLWGQERWEMLSTLFIETHHRLLSLPSFPLLHIALSSGLSALKTPACHTAGARDLADTPNSAPGNSLDSSMCPICSAELNELAENVPYAHHSKSHVEHDLVLLPNDRVYGKARLEEYARKSGLPHNCVKDLRTGEIYPASRMKKVFIT
ncbi:GID complex subunit containing RING finger motif [Pyricularia oryzae]|uniref:Protein FYV10 n=5 Tax=Pyricularia TaxID=48558 RepID=FYV10_PYRO7|nr:uncharacterized protein MGG_01665 [Pyricularia oryzae 70-15]A4RK04.2 RecName: Full=Protein FYV10 [Pyricularia oryzae 70-15]ELQ43299.1 hypothetical protein OOU_Y34scaffold00162g68 [Pyricularia oryzae Y34]KAH8839071.1 GID complex subunit containing RING finger motif [Pyricularia oryzae]KAI6291003.1 GID complex subunit containing RING finger motif [Pyricularia grisea]EHA54844.1 hypothetical protein MGG_01665 [Pyricularia oryzae 70-15]KAH9438911.1 GID complex subunit containing RING finger mot